MKDQTAAATRFRVWREHELEELPPLEWLVEGWLHRGSLAVLYGEPGVGKSLMALSLACSIQTGMPWFGKVVVKSPALYVAAGEGAAGWRDRLRAWKSANAVGETPIGIGLVVDAPNLLDPLDSEALVRGVLAFHKTPALVVIDTLARTMGGGNENDAGDMGRAIAAADALRHRSDATVLFVHHPSKTGGLERGSGALRGAADTVMQLRGRDGQVVLTAEKQKDCAPASELRFRLQPSGNSVILAACGKAANSSLDLKPDEMRALGALGGSSEKGKTQSSREWRERSGLAERTFYRVRGALVRRGLVQDIGERAHPTYSLTDVGCEALAANCQTAANQLPVSAAATALGSVMPQRGSGAGREQPTDVRGAHP